MAPPLVTLFRTYVSFSFEMQILEAGSAAELASHPMALSRGAWLGLVPAGAHWTTLALSLSRLGIYCTAGKQDTDRLLGLMSPPYVFL